MTFTKLDSGITDSTIWQAPDATRLVWITMLAMADWHGYIGASVPGLASRARVPLDKCREALVTLLAPDQDSRTTEHEGRRIAVADGGWVLLNHAKYRALISEDDRRERSRIAMQKLRASKKEAVNHVNSALTKLAHTDTDTDTDIEREAFASQTRPKKASSKKIPESQWPVKDPTATVESNSAEQTAAYIRSQQMSEEERAKAEEARKSAMSKLRSA